MYITLPESSSALQTNSNVLTGILFLLFVSPTPLPPPPRLPAGAVRISRPLPAPHPVPPRFRGLGARRERPAGSGDHRPGWRPSAGAHWHATSLPCHRPPPVLSPCQCCRAVAGTPWLPLPLQQPGTGCGCLLRGGWHIWILPEML